jgi:hypothetical protein
MSNLILDYLEFCQPKLMTFNYYKRQLGTAPFKLEVVFQRFQQAGVKVKVTKSFFGKTNLEYLGIWITCDGIQLLSKIVQAILQSAKPMVKKKSRHFISWEQSLLRVSVPLHFIHASTTPHKRKQLG